MARRLCICWTDVTISNLKLERGPSPQIKNKRSFSSRSEYGFVPIWLAPYKKQPPDPLGSAMCSALSVCWRMKLTSFFMTSLTRLKKKRYFHFYLLQWRRILKKKMESAMLLFLKRTNMLLKADSGGCHFIPLGWNVFADLGRINEKSESATVF